MVWALLAILSALLLGVYDIFKKKSLVDNAVIPVLFFSSLTSAIICLPIVLYAYFGDVATDSVFYFRSLTFQAHVLIFVKSVIVGSSWTLAYFAMKHLPNYRSRNGMPNNLSNSRASSSVLAVVTVVTLRPLILATLL